MRQSFVLAALPRVLTHAALAASLMSAFIPVASAQPAPPTLLHSPIISRGPVPGYFQPIGDHVDAFERDGKFLHYKTTFDKYSCIKIVRYWPDESHAEISVRRDLKSPAVTAYVQPHKLEPALYCSEDGIYMPPQPYRPSAYSAREDARKPLSGRGVASTHDARVYANPQPGSLMLATINKGDCLLVRGYDARTAHSHIVMRNPRDPLGPPIEGYVVRLQTDRARVCVP